MESNKVNKSEKIAPKSKLSPLMRTGKLFAYLMILPGLLHFCVFWLGVNVSSIALAFKDTAGNASFVNFLDLFDEFKRTDSGIFIALKNTMSYYLVGVFKLVLCCLVAYLFYKKVYGHKIYKFLFFLPTMIPSMVYIIIFKRFISAWGPLDTLWRNITGNPLPNLLNTNETATRTILFYSLWAGFGPQMLIFVGAMNRIPEEIIEAAKLDGCVGAREFARIVIPLVWETLATYLLLATAQVFMSTGPILFFTGGDCHTQTLSFWIYQQVQGGFYNYPAAVGLFFTVVALPIVFLMRYLLNKIETVTY